MLGTTLAGVLQAAPVSQVPLQVASGAPGNILLLPSSAHGAMAAAANPGSVYATGERYFGYFDPDKCYAYRAGEAGTERYFQSVGPALAHVCRQAWSGNFLNWATAQAIDVYRAVLTGGDRFIDSAALTVLQKGRNLVRDAAFPDRLLPVDTVAGATPFSGATLYLRVAGEGRSLLLGRSPDFPGEPQELPPAAPLLPETTYRIEVRVQVCIAGQLERNCQRYGDYYKPEGLLQQYSGRLRFSLFGRSDRETGVVLRAPQKFVGPWLDDGRDNPLKEWSAQTGIFIDRQAGVIVQFNRFDETPSPPVDDLGELLHAATGYLRHQGAHADPLTYACQRNALLGIGGAGEGEAGASLLRLGDRQVVQATQQVAAMQGGAGSAASLALAGVAYDAHAGDLRPDLPGRQSAATYWLASSHEVAGPGSALWLATQYGGFAIPRGYSLVHTAALPESAWQGADGWPLNLLRLTDPDQLRDELKQAFVHVAGDEPRSIGNFSAGPNPGEWFSTLLAGRRWSGDLQLWREDEQQPQWSAARRLDELSETQLAGRNILTVRPATADADGTVVARAGTPFAWSALDDAQRRRLGGEQGELLVDYLRGSRLQERREPGSALPFRLRTSRLGDIAGSRPVYSWHDPQPYGELLKPLGTGYREFLASARYQQRAPLVAVGANDGMLHGFDARDGRELFAYVPAAVLGHLHELAAPGYAHRYYVDGTPTVGNAWIGEEWRSLLVGSTGAGGNSLYALDVTDPERVESGSVLWEFSHPDLGYTLGRPGLMALGSGRFVVAVSSGARDPQSQGGDIWLLDAADGRVLKRIHLPEAGDLGPVTAISSRGDVTADRLYVGDSLGNLWRVDLSGDAGGDSAIPPSLAGKPLFRALAPDGQPQAISASVAAVLDRSGQVRVLFGTGRYYRVGDDEPSAATESLYGVLDDGRALAGRSGLLPVPGKDGVRGWYLDLPADGSRVVEQPQVRDGKLVAFNLIAPGDDPCGDPLAHALVVLDIGSGERLAGGLPNTDRAGGDVLQQSSGALLQSDPAGALRVLGVDPAGRPQGQAVDLPRDSGRKAWWESR
ncbi:pilus assembly protein [Pseudomonas nitroreducens]|uniref:pilus assembly protein n=1 Tax=Pseudomonas nitroreducens TaxID=46680 RepID=UPI00209F4AC2|nr:PilC/PilY family type IV pilus protein [Pseudomonas nitroreducens]MCP1623426.1 type IV pilus assembly protein PilY1 [Pseudomonas nitroreducens]